MRIFSRLLAATLVAWCPHLALATDSYPSRPILLIVPLAAGSTNDVMARAIQHRLAELLGQRVIVENRPGAGGQIGMRSVARASPDGYTLIIAASNTWAINVGLFQNLQYDPVNDFAPVAYLATASNTLVVNGKSPLGRVGDLVEDMRKKPGHYNFSSGGHGTSQHLGGELLSTVTNTQAVHIPFGGAPQGIMAVVAGHADFGFYNTPSVLSLVRDGQLRALAVTSHERSVLLPEVPTMAQEGFSDYEMGVAMGILAPAGTPVHVIAKLNHAVRQIMDDKEFRSQLEAQGYDNFRTMSPDELGRFIKEEIARWTPLVTRSGAPRN